jgi:hypothetical protein
MTVTDPDADAAVPATGEPDRALVNTLLKNLIDDILVGACLVGEDDGNVVVRTANGGIKLKDADSDGDSWFIEEYPTGPLVFRHGADLASSVIRFQVSESGLTPLAVTIINAEGDLLIGAADNAATRLARGSVGEFLGIRADGLRPEWQNPYLTVPNVTVAQIEDAANAINTTDKTRFRVVRVSDFSLGPVLMYPDPADATITATTPWVIIGNVEGAVPS